MPDDHRSTEDLIRKALQDNDPTAWFEEVYARAIAGDGVVPWAHMTPHPLLAEWAARHHLQGEGQRALVIGCGLGDDAEELARRGFQVTAFDISPTAIQTARERFADSGIDFRVADLFDPPSEWRHHFDFVLENRTVQALPWHLADPAIRQIAGFVAPQGRLLVICLGREPQESRRGIPWPLSHEELAGFEQYGLVEEQFEDIPSSRRHFRILYRAKNNLEEQQL